MSIQERDFWMALAPFIFHSEIHRTELWFLLGERLGESGEAVGRPVLGEELFITRASGRHVDALTGCGNHLHENIGGVGDGR